MPLAFTRLQGTLTRVAAVAPALVLGAWALVVVAVFAGWARPRGAWVAYWVGSIAVALVVASWAWAMRERHLRESALPRFLQRKLRETYPDLSAKDCALVERGLRQFFLACLRSRGKFVAMPSQAVDTLWHAFILHTQAYDQWCRRGLGFFLHHTPAEALGREPRRNDGLRRAWYWACRDEAIDPRSPSRLPLLFALDAKLAIPQGFHYVPDCETVARLGPALPGGGTPHCGTSFADGSHSGSSGDFGGVDTSSTSSDGGSDGGGDGGGCGGGGD